MNDKCKYRGVTSLLNCRVTTECKNSHIDPEKKQNLQCKLELQGYTFTEGSHRMNMGSIIEKHSLDSVLWLHFLISS